MTTINATASPIKYTLKSNAPENSASTNNSNSSSNTNNIKSQKEGNDNKAPAKKFSGRQNPLNQEFDAKLARIDARIGNGKAKMEDLRTFGGKSGGGNEAQRLERSQLIEKVKALREQLKPVQNERRRMIDEIQADRQMLKKRTGSAQEAKDKLPFKSIPEMERKVAEYEAKVESGQYSLPEEKQFLLEISKLKKARRTLEGIDGATGDVSALKMKIERNNDLIAEKNKVIAKTRAEIDAISAKLDALNAVSSQGAQERAQRQKQMDKIRAEIDAAYAERKAAFEEFHAAKKAQIEARIKRDARRALDDQKWSMEKELEKLQEKLAHFNPETKVDLQRKSLANVAAFFKQATGADNSKNGASSESPSTASSLPASKPARSVQISAEFANALNLAREEKEEKSKECFFAPSTKKSAPSNSTTPSTSFNFNKLPMHILSALASHSLSIPSGPADLPALYAAIKAKEEECDRKSAASLAIKEKERQEIIVQIEAKQAEIENVNKTPLVDLMNEEDASFINKDKSESDKKNEK